MSNYPTPDLSDVLCLGIAGNFAGHLEQAGETPDFVNIQTQTATAPKGIFPYYIPSHSGLLGDSPISATEIRYPRDLAENAHLQAEPEVCVLFNVSYDENTVTNIQPVAFAAFNDCSIRKPGAKKISEKKNWGKATKGLSNDFIALTGFDEGCELDQFHIASFLKRDGQLHTYGNDSAITTYSYFHQQLKSWIIDKLNNQQDVGPLEHLQSHLKTAGYPAQVMISLGATTYTPFGESEFLTIGDELFFYVYDATQHSAREIEQHAKDASAFNLKNSSFLHQIIT